MSGAQVYEPEIRALLGTASHFSKLVFSVPRSLCARALPSQGGENALHPTSEPPMLDTGTVVSRERGTPASGLRAFSVIPLRISFSPPRDFISQNVFVN